jgi:hypothetical protein
VCAKGDGKLVPVHLAMRTPHDNHERSKTSHWGQPSASKEIFLQMRRYSFFICIINYTLKRLAEH